MTRAEEDALAEQWAHIDVTTTGRGNYAFFSQDSGPSSGHQVITVNGAHAEALVIGGMAYAKGDATAVTTFFRFPSSQVARLANQWISFTGDDAGFSTVSSGVTLRSALGEDGLSGNLRVGAPTYIDGVKAVPISGTVYPAGGGPGATGTLYISAGPSPLPVELDVTAADGTTSRVRYSRWGRAVQLSPPPSAIPSSSIPPAAAA